MYSKDIYPCSMFRFIGGDTQVKKSAQKAMAINEETCYENIYTRPHWVITDVGAENSNACKIYS